MSSDIKERLTAFADAHDQAVAFQTTAKLDPHRTVDLGQLAADAFPHGARELGDAFVRHGRPQPTVGQILDYSRLLARGAERLTSKVAAVGGVPASDAELRESGIRPMSLSPHATAAERMVVAEQLLALVSAAMRIKPGSPAEIFGIGGNP